MRILDWKKGGLVVLLLLLPWQMRWIFGQVELIGEPISLGTLSLYATQVIIALLVIAHLIAGEKRLRIQPHAWFIAFIFIGTAALAQHIELAVLHLVTLFFAYLLAWLLKKTDLPRRQLMQVIIVSLLLPVALGFFQFIVGSSAASTWLGLAARDAAVLGESVFFFGGERVLRAYGSFPHPNIFAGYLLLGLWAAWQLMQEKRLWAWGAIGVFALALLATGSQAALLGTLAAVVWIALKPQQKHRWTAIIILTVVSLAAVWIGGGDSLVERQQQYLALFHVLNPQFLITGVGQMNYLFHWEVMQTGLDWWMYQPLHNVPLLMIGELGVIGFGAWLYYLAAPKIHRLVQSTHFPLILAFIPPLLLDHYLWTTWAGLAILAMISSLDRGVLGDKIIANK